MIEGRFGTVLVDGLIGGTWKIDRMDGAAALRAELVVPLGRRDLDAVAEEGERPLAFTDPKLHADVYVTHLTKSRTGSRRTESTATGTPGARLAIVSEKEK